MESVGVGHHHDACNGQDSSYDLWEERGVGQGGARVGEGESGRESLSEVMNDTPARMAVIKTAGALWLRGESTVARRARSLRQS